MADEARVDEINATRTPSPPPLMSFLIHRHGLRDPFVRFDGIGAAAPEPDKAGHPVMLTERGRAQLRALGTFLAMKQAAPKGPASSSVSPARAAFLSAQLISPKAFSSAVPRCLESAQILYKSFLVKDLDITNLKVDYHNLYHKIFKQNSDAMMEAPFETPHGKTVKDYVDFLNEKANSAYTDWQKRYQIVEALLVAKKEGYELPSYADADTLARCLDVMLMALVEGFHREYALEIMQDMKHRLDHLPDLVSSANWVSYSVSDLHVVSMFKLLGFPVSRWPDFAQAFELRIFPDNTVYLDRIDTSSDAKVTEKAAIHRTTVEQMRSAIQATIETTELPPSGTDGRMSSSEQQYE